MPLELVGLLGHRHFTPSYTSPKIFDPEYLMLIAQALEASGYDRALIAQSAFWPDSMPLAAHVLAGTKRLKVMVAHRPGFVAPTMAARMFATLDNLSNGRAGIHIITGGLDAELASDGDFLTKDQRYLRSAEFVQILRGIWTNTRPFDYEGQFYRFTQALSELRPSEPTGIPIYWGGNSPIARRLAAENCDIYSFSLTKLAEAKAVIDEVRALVPLGVRTPAFQGNLRIILGRTEQLAWRNARELASLLADQAEARRRETGSGRDHRSSLGRPELKGKSDNEPGTQERYADAIDLPPVDTCLWFGTFQASGGSNPPSLVGTPDTVAKAILAYYKLGIKSLMMRGFNQLPDAVEHGLELIPRIRELVAEHDGAT